MPRLDVIILARLLIVIIVVVVVVVGAVSWRPLHLVLLLESPARVREPRRHLRQRHLGDDRQHDLLAFRRIRVLDVFVQPSLQRARRLARRVLAAHVQCPVTNAFITTKNCISRFRLSLPPFMGQ